MHSASLLDSYSVQILNQPQQFVEMRYSWGALWSASQASVFNSWEWLHPWHTEVAPNVQLHILKIDAPSGELIGLIPLAMHRESIGGLNLRRIFFLGEAYVGSDYLDVVALRGREVEVAQVGFQFLMQRHSDWDIIELMDFDESSLSLPILEDCVRNARFESRVEQRFLCPYTTFSEGETFKGFLRGCSRRDNYLRRRKWLEKQPGFRIEKTTDADLLEKPLAEFFRLHSRRWESDGGSSGISSPKVEAFHRATTRQLAAKGILRFYTLYVGAEAVASVYGMRERGKFIYYQSGYEPEWAAKSVGLVLVGEVFRDALSEHAIEFDFLRGTENYKFDWVRHQRRTVSMKIWKPQSLGHWAVRMQDAHLASRNAVKRALPSKWLEGLRRWRRKRASGL